MKKTLFLTIVLIFISGSIYCQVGIGTTTPDASTILDINSSNKGILIPRVALVNLNSDAPVTSATTGVLVYNTNATIGIGFYYWNGSVWVSLNPDADWHKTNGSADLGQADAIGNNIYTNGFVGLNTLNPLGKLSIQTDGSDTVNQGIVFTDERSGSFTTASIHSFEEAGFNGGLVFSTDGDGNQDNVDVSGLTEKMRIQPNGNVGMGETNPAGALHIRNESDQGDTKLIIEADAGDTNELEGGIVEFRADGGLLQSAIGHNFISVPAGGSNGLHIASAGSGGAVGNSGIYFYTGTTNSTQYTDSDVNLKLHISNSDAVNASSTDHIRIDTYNVTGPTGGSVSVDNGLTIYPNENNNGGIGRSGNAWDDAFITEIYYNDLVDVSDRRAKTNIVSVNSGMEKIMKINPVKFDYIKEKHPLTRTGRLTKEEEESLKNRYGFIAQELKEVIPEMVIHDESEDLYLIKNHHQLIPILVKALQEENDRLAAAETKIQNLEEQLKKMMNDINQLKKGIRK